VPFAQAAPKPPTDDAVRQKTKEVLSRPEFGSGDKTQQWLLERITELLEWMGSLRQSHPVLRWLIIAACVLILGLLIAHVTWLVSRTFALGRRLREGGPEQAQRARLSASYHDEALRKAAAGEFTEAIRFLFLSLVYRFDESGRVSFQKAYTNREYLSLFADRPDLQSELQVFVDTLDENWYGQHPTERERYENCLRLYETVV
jgi:hypothetical protein